MKSLLVQVFQINEYDEDNIFRQIPTDLFNSIKPGDTVVLKPNWIRECHIDREDEWEQVITHPTIITAVLKRVLVSLNGSGKIIITDGPETSSDFQKILGYCPEDTWFNECKAHGVSLEIIDLRDDVWTMKQGLVVKREKRIGDPRGKVLTNLVGRNSEFFGKGKSKRGFYGADYNRRETNKAHDGMNNLYSVSRSVIDCDVFINLPKLKTHKKAGITCCLKNLVGINTYKNYLPHHNEGGPKEHGDQFPTSNKNSRIEGPIVAFFKQRILINPALAKLLKPFVKIGTTVFGETSQVIRSGNWYGNDVIWRTILDLNKVLYYSNNDGTLRQDKLINAKNYIGIVDGITVGEGNGPQAPDPVKLGYIVYGTNPAAIDAVCAELMGFDPTKIPTINNAFKIKKYRLTDFSLSDIRIQIGNGAYNIGMLPNIYVKPCNPHFGWKDHIERSQY